ncbi:ABC transporter substrate-binding protein [Oceanibacterium hippocampi]|uniref:Thiamine pyrimidine synthase n=1 Tax=Oceanibacterium hippocampi TaxID=745714 RepID=A0A1Y5SLK3_9PROT|nr:ABC transporter substrate-binding protein [Oceanibacterium hippocampi]SLN43217.1 NMT1/THI5 like protein [Oceanibacterium hippocampi]
MTRHFRSLNRRQMLAGTAMTAAALGMGGTLLGISRPAHAATTVNMQLGWLASNGVIGEVVASKLGYYAESGIELEITPGGPSVDGVASVAAGRAMVGQLSSSPSLMLARSAGIPIKCIAAGYQKHPFTYFSREQAPIRSAQDMVGKTIATNKTAYILLRALLAKNGIAEDQVTIVPMGSDMNQLMTGQAQAVTGWLTNTNALKVIGDDRVDLMLWDTGIQLYANPYYVTDQTLDTEFDTVVNFLKGSARGWEYAYNNPEKAVDMLVEAYPRMEKASEMEAIQGVLGFSFTDKTKAKGWGTMETDNWAEQIEIYAKLDQFKGEVPKVEDVMTLAVLEATADVRPKIG